MGVPIFEHTLFEYCINPTAFQIKQIFQILLKDHDHSVEGNFGENAKSAQTVIYFFLLM